MMINWRQFNEAATDIAACGRALLFSETGGEVALLATVRNDGSAAIAPICPIFSGPGVYLLAGAATPKVRHLNSNGSYALHAQVGADDIEFQMSGRVEPVPPGPVKDRVLAAIPFPSWDARDPLFELMIGRALSVTWPSPGQARRLSFVVPEQV